MAFKPSIIAMCPKCHDIIYSSFSGQFKTCKCGILSIDDTEDCCRMIGDREIWEQATIYVEKDVDKSIK